MKKQNFLLSFLAIIMLCFSISMFACDDGKKNLNSYENFNSSLQTFKADPTVFKTYNISGLDTNFYFDNFNTKNEEGEKIENDQVIILINAYGMNFIERYYTLLKDLKGYNFSALNNSIYRLNESFIKIQLASKNVYNANLTTSYEIYNGFFAKYKEYSLDFIMDVYDTALTLSDFLINQVKYTSALATDKQTKEQIQFYVDYQVLMIFDDYKTLFLESAKGEKLANNLLFTYANSMIDSYASTFNKYILKDNISKETMQEIIGISNKLQTHREMANKALNGFSLYDFVGKYDQSITEYDKDNSYADVYYSYLDEYFSINNANGVLKNYKTYIWGKLFND